jgi:hypothetical protein
VNTCIALLFLCLPLAAIYQTGEIEGCSFAVYERLSGEDLETAYPEGRPCCWRCDRTRTT